MPLTAQVAVADATPYYDKMYTYLVPLALNGSICVGSTVIVPFGTGKARVRLGVVLGLEDAEKHGKLKEIIDAAPSETRLNDELLAIVHYLKEATFCTWFEAVKAVIPKGAQYKIARSGDKCQLKQVMEKPAETIYIKDKLYDEAECKLTAKQSAVMHFMGEEAKTQKEICENCNVTVAVVTGLVKRGLLLVQSREVGEKLAVVPTTSNRTDYELNNAQVQAVKTILKHMGQEKPNPVLLYGVTGSGKTHVFIKLINNVLKAGRTALVLVPEIGLTPQMMQILCEAFGSAVAVQHSGLSAGQRVRQWRTIQNGSAKVVVGTRSAVFAPLENIGIIVVDEEQERTYQSESAPRHDAIEVAKRRAARHGALLVLASATPSVASFYKAQKGLYKLVRLDKRYGDMPLPQVDMVDMAAELMAGNSGALSEALANAAEETIAAGRQVILLLNRRGYHRVALCRSCGKSLKCENCSVPMVLHRRKKDEIVRDEEDCVLPRDAFLVCHHCGTMKDPAPSECPYCGGDLRYAGFGTQRLEEELAVRLPNARVLRLDMDTTSRKGMREKMLKDFGEGKADILLGTQMVAKGLDFERVSLVGVVGIDSLLFSQGYRAFETVFSLVTQVVGRSGRAGIPGRAMIQTVDAKNPVLLQAAAQNYEEFYKQEIAFRRIALYPPFCTLCTVGVAAKTGTDAMCAASAFAKMLAKRAKIQTDVPLRILGPVPMQPELIAGSYRWRLTLKCRMDASLRKLVNSAMEEYNKEGWPKKTTLWLDFNTEG